MTYAEGSLRSQRGAAHSLLDCSLAQSQDKPAVRQVRETTDQDSPLQRKLDQLKAAPDHTKAVICPQPEYM